MFSAFSFTQLSMHSIMSDGTALAFHRIEIENKQTKKRSVTLTIFTQLKVKCRLHVGTITNYVEHICNLHYRAIHNVLEYIHNTLPPLVLYTY